MALLARLRADRTADLLRMILTLVTYRWVDYIIKACKWNDGAITATGATEGELGHILKLL